MWDGSPLPKDVVVVRCYHGLGDSIQFLRYLPMLKRQCRRVIVEAEWHLSEQLQPLRLFRQPRPGDWQPAVRELTQSLSAFLRSD